MKSLLAGVFITLILAGCAQDPKKIVVPEKFESVQQMQEFGEKIKDLPKEDRELLGDYIIGGLGDGVKKIKGTTVGEAIEAQRQYNAKKKQEEDQQKAKEAKAKVELEKLKQQLVQTITVTVTEKFMEAGNLENYDLSNYVITQIAVQNHSQKSIKAIKGYLTFKNSFGDTVKNIMVYDENLDLKPNETMQMTNRESTLGSLDRKYQEAELAELQHPFEAEQIIFTDGSKLALPSK